MINYISSYLTRLHNVTKDFDWTNVIQLYDDILLARISGKNIFVCGNGGSAANAIHIANDFVYGVEPTGKALKIEALSANSAVLTCLGNDIGYENIFSHQLKVKASAGDVLLVLSGSGNSPNIINAIKQADELNMHTHAVLGFSGGKAKTLVNNAIHFPIEDMQISEDLQLMVGHMLMQYMHDQLKTINTDNNTSKAMR